MRWGVDAAYPPVADQPARLVAQGWSWIGGYIGGRAEHVWLPSDWENCSVAGLALLPIWVAPASDEPADLGSSDGNAALEAMRANGLSGVVVLDVENGADLTQYAFGFADAVHAGNCRVVLYGTSPTLLSTGNNVKVDDWWLASWPSSPMPLQPAPPDWRLWQWAAGEAFDFDVASDEFQFADFVPVSS
jgi:hypothetical protein